MLFRSGMAWEATAVIATIIMAFVFLPMYLRKGYTTLPEFMEERYGVGVRRMVSILFLIGYLVIGIPVPLYWRDNHSPAGYPDL